MLLLWKVHNPMSDAAAPRPITFSQRRTPTIRVATLLRLTLVGVFIGNLGRIPAFSTGQRDAAILLNDLFVAFLLIAGTSIMLARRSLRLDGVALLALLFAAIGAASTLDSIPRFGLTAFQTVVSLGYLARWLFYFGVYVVLINTIRRDEVADIWHSIEWLILAFAIFGIIQSLTMPNFAQLVYPHSRARLDWDPQGHRLVSTWLDPVFAGAFIMFALLIELAELAVSAAGGRRIPAWKPVLLGLAMLLTASRAALIATFAGGIVILASRGLSKRMLRVSAAVALLSAVALPPVIWLTNQANKLQLVNESALQRYVEWSRALRVFLEHPIIGIGFNAWGFVEERYGYERAYVFSYSIDGGLIFVALMTGLVGLSVYVAMLWFVMRRTRRIWSSADATIDERGLALGVAACTVALVVDSLFGNSLFFPFLMETMWVLWALVFAIRRQSRVATT